MQPDEIRDLLVESIQASFSGLGLSLKLRVTVLADDSDLGVNVPLPTFLKGTWFVLPNHPFERMWSPLPSRLLKLGKCLRNPIEIALLPEQEADYKKGLLSVEDAYKLALKNFSCSIALAVVDYHWPIHIKAWLVSLVPPGDRATYQPIVDRIYKGDFQSDQYGFSAIPIDQQSVRAKPGEIADAEARDALDEYQDVAHVCREIATLYKTTPDVVEDFFHHLRSVDFLCHFEHPFWFNLAQDYA
jgi:hypothetical protein